LENPSNHIQNSHYQIELPIEIEDTSEDRVLDIHTLLENQSREIERQHVDTQSLLGGLVEANAILYQLQESDSTELIAAMSQKIAAIEQSLVKIYHYLKEDTVGKELKAGQQNLQKAIASLEAKKEKDPHNLVYLDWKQIAMIIVATAIISSLCSLAAFQVASNLQTNKASTPTEKSLKPKIKKVPQR
jgi:hypothetical protein